MERKIRVYSRKTVNRISSDNLPALAKRKSKIKIAEYNKLYKLEMVPG